MNLTKEKILKILEKVKNKKIIQEIDFYCFKNLISYFSIQNLLILLILNHAIHYGHTCLPIKYFFTNHLLQKKIVQLKKFWELFKNLEFWKKKKQKKIPYIIKKNMVYLFRYWEIEKNIIFFLKRTNPNYLNKIKKFKKEYQNICKNFLDSQQKISLGILLLNKISFLIGGPGTGKTTLIAYFLMIIIKTKTRPLHIALTALTGKATFQLYETIQTFFFKKKKYNFKKKNFISSMTLHKLLDKKENSLNKLKIIQKKKIDILIIDESSMIDIQMMSLICKKISKKTKIIFLGDINQLPPIEMASILKEICFKACNQYNKKFSQHLYNLTNEKVIISKNISFQNLKNSITILKKNYRFKENKQIIYITKILEEKKKITLNNLNYFKNTQNFLYKNIKTSKCFYKMLKKIKKLYKKHWKYIKKSKNIKEILRNFHKKRILCVTNEGYFGTIFLNNFLDNYFYEKYTQIKKYNKKINKIWYHGKVIIITKNNTKLKLFNGTIGICLIHKKKYKIFFYSENNSLIFYDPFLITNFKSAWVITIHKSQGSEFNQIILIFPNYHTNLLTKELFYTAITRTKKKILIYINPKILLKTLNTTQKKYSGIHQYI
ncbi:exodeoxyribonuclease V subunit alpha [Buchnera aphidicola]|uniref:exodeoxyribonuclease V subunit alpha n=1 Tax=Buchnera aphidicola TaxID=9 RepID=UPI00313CD3E9